MNYRILAGAVSVVAVVSGILLGLYSRGGALNPGPWVLSPGVTMTGYSSPWMTVGWVMAGAGAVGVIYTAATAAIGLKRNSPA